MKYDLLYVIGDSFVHAIHQADDIAGEVTVANRFSSLIAAHYDLPEVNKGLPGGSNEYIFRNIYEDMTAFKKAGVTPLVVVVYTDHTRKEIFYNSINGAQTICDTFATTTFLKEYYANHVDFEFLKSVSAVQITAIKMFLDYHRIDFVDTWSMGDMLTLEDVSRTQLDKTIGEFCNTDRFYIAEQDTRWLPYGHPNVTGHARTAQWFIDKIDLLYSPNKT